MREMLEDNTIEETLVTLDEYVENPFNCPVCGSDDTIVERPDYEIERILVTKECNDCGAYWTERFMLTSLTSVCLPRKRFLLSDLSEENDKPFITKIPIKGK